jgi:ferredoxin--NADP+ reductase/benzoate/toluate 1,2-dioxygenase reductase subunit
MEPRPIHHVQQVRRVGPAAFVLRFERHGLPFEPGQHIAVGLRGALAMREYSLYSGSSDDFLEVLVREIPDGLVSPALARCRAGDELSVDGPYGLFLTDPSERRTAKYLFVGSGTGIAPFHCLLRSYPGMDYLLLHGVRALEDRFDFEEFERSRYVACVSRAEGGDYRGRVTGWLSEHDVDPSWQCYLCGNSDMIYESFAILRRRGVPRERLHAEVYF